MDDERELEVIRHEMEGTRASLAEKVEALENQVLGTVHTATSTVTETVEDVKSAVGAVTDTVQGAVESVKEAFNLSEQVRRRPWAMLGASCALGFLGGWLLGRSRREEEQYTPGPYQPQPFPAPRAAETAAALPARQEEEDEGPGVLQPIRELAVGTLMGVLREMVTGALPEGIKSDAAGIVDNLTTRVGGKVICDPLGTHSEGASGAGNGHTATTTSYTGAAATEPATTADRPARRRGAAGRR